ncbi:MAG: hypothetical protein AB8H86_18205 [Polyangiales bacterium]
MTIRFSYSPADAILTLGVRNQPDEIIERALKRAAETAAVEIRVCDASSANRWPAIAELCVRQGPRFVYRRVSNTKSKNANAA